MAELDNGLCGLRNLKIEFGAESIFFNFFQPFLKF